MATAPKPTKAHDDEAQLHEMLKGFDNAILMTKKSDGTEHLHGRPMHIVAVEDDHSVWFFTSVDNQVAHEALLDTEAYLIGQSTAQHLVLRGWVAVTKDRSRTEKYWSKAYEIWFPEGKNDPNLAVMKFTPREGEFWDTSGVKGVRYWASAAKAFVTRTTPKAEEEIHGKVRM